MTLRSIIAQARVPAAAFALAAAATSCGGESDSADPAAPLAPPAWGLPGGHAPDEPLDAVPFRGAVDVEACDLVLMVVIDGAARDEFSLYGAEAPSTPRIDAVAAGAAVYSDAIAVSTAGNAGLASILTGRHPREHGVASLRDLGRTGLPASERTLAEGFGDLGWRTLASLSESRQARGFAGLAQGFESFEAPRLGEAPRSAAAVALGAREALDTMLVPGQRVFAFVAFGDLDDRRRGLPSATRAAPFVEARLREIAGRRADIAALLDRLPLEPNIALAELKSLLGRARGSEAARAWRRALRDARLNEIDAAVGTLLDVVEAAGRAETATIVVCAPRGRAPASTGARAGARFVSSILDVPLIVRWPHGTRHGRVHGVTSVIDAPQALGQIFGLGLEPSRFATRTLLGGAIARATAFVSDGPLTNFAGVRVAAQIERYGLVQATVTFPRAGDEGDGGPLEPLQEWAKDGSDLALFHAFSAPANLTVVRADGAPQLSIRWRLPSGHGAVVGEADETSTRRERLRGLSGSARLTKTGGETLELAIERRTEAVWLDLDAGEAALSPAAVAIGTALLSELPVLFLPSGSGQPVAPDEAALVRLSRAEGVWWKLAVGGEGPVEVLVGTWPPRSPEDELEVIAGGPVLRHDVPGREDLVRLVGNAPFDLRIKRFGKEKFALACRHGERFVRPEEIVSADRRYGTTSAFSILAPSWQPGISDALGDTTGPLYAAEALHAPVTIRRSGIGPTRGREAALDRSALQFLKTLPPGE